MFWSYSRVSNRREISFGLKNKDQLRTINYYQIFAKLRTATTENFAVVLIKNSNPLQSNYDVAN